MGKYFRKIFYEEKVKEIIMFISVTENSVCVCGVCVACVCVVACMCVYLCVVSIDMQGCWRDNFEG